MAEELWFVREEREVTARLEALLALPMPEADDLVHEGVFNPWRLLPGVYGSYSSDFDQCATDVLTEVASGEKIRGDLGAEMFREMLCTANLCEYGTSPRFCFPTPGFKPFLPEILARWKAYSHIMWSKDA